jgi:hypothetical protein
LLQRGAGLRSCVRTQEEEGERIMLAIGLPVDLLMLEAVRNPYLKANLERNRRLRYAA